MARNARLARLRLIPAVGAALALILAGCGAGQISQTAQQVAAVDGGYGNAGALAVRDVRLAGTSDAGYKAGADIPLKLWIANSAVTVDTLAGVSSTAAASVAITGSAEVQGQSLVEVSADTPLKITVTGIKDQLNYGHSIPITFSFAAAGPVTVNVPIEIPAERETAARPTVDNLPPAEGNIWFGEESGSEGSHSVESSAP